MVEPFARPSRPAFALATALVGLAWFGADSATNVALAAADGKASPANAVNRPTSRPPAILSLQPAQSGATFSGALRPRVGEAVAFSLAVDGQHSFQAANIGQFTVRSGDRLDSIPVPRTPGTAPVLSFERPGPAAILLSASAQASRASDAWQRVTHCTRIIVNVEADDGKLPPVYHDPGVNTKAGMRIELLPLVQTFRMHVGDELPVKSYFRGHTAAGVEVTAIRPDGSEVRDRSTAWGVAHFPMDQAGVWTLRYEKTHEGVRHVAELIFEISREVPR